MCGPSKQHGPRGKPPVPQRGGVAAHDGDETIVDSCEPGHRLVLTARGRPLGEAQVVLELRDEEIGCLVTMHETPTAGTGRWLHSPISEALLVRRNTESLARLAAVVEVRTSPGVSQLR